jgi:glycosyltransferase involved in cell wall biosynthesis
MDVYADGLISGLKTVRPDWEFIQIIPKQRYEGSSLLNGLKKYYQRYWNYPQYVKNQDVDLFHIIDHSDGHLAYWLRSTGKPTVITCHDLINFLQPENVSTQARLPFISMAAWKFAVRGLGKADRIISVSAHTAKDVEKILNIESERLTVIPNAVDSLFRPLPQKDVEELRQQYQVPPDTVCLLNVGSNHPRKNVFTILKVVAVLKHKGVPVYLLKTGEDFTEEQKLFIQNHHLGDCISYIGKPDKPSLVRIYNAADILLSPSLYEGFGLTILEAMACGTAVVTSNVTSLPEVAGDAAILVNPLDVRAIVEAVSHLYENHSDRKTLIEKGLARTKDFTWEKTAEKVAIVYEENLTAKNKS